MSHPGKAVKQVMLTKTPHPIQALPKDFDPAIPPPARATQRDPNAVNPLLFGGLH